MYQRLVAISLTLNVLSLVLGITLIVVVLVLTLALAAEHTVPVDDSESKPSESEAFGYILSLGPLLIVNALCGVSASQRASTTTVIFYWVTLIATVSVSFWVTSDYIDYYHMFDFANVTTIEVVSKLVVFICVMEIISAVLVSLANLQNNRVSVKDEESSYSGQLNSNNVGSNEEQPGLRLVSLTRDSSAS